MGKGLTVVLIERKEQYSTLQPPTLFLWCGVRTASIGRTIMMVIRTKNADGGTEKRRTPMTFAAMEHERTVTRRADWHL